MGNFLAYFSASACQLHFRNLSDPGDPVKNEPKSFQIMYTTLVELFQEQQQHGSPPQHPDGLEG